MGCKASKVKQSVRKEPVNTESHEKVEKPEKETSNLDPTNSEDPPASEKLSEHSEAKSLDSKENFNEQSGGDPSVSGDGEGGGSDGQDGGSVAEASQDLQESLKDASVDDNTGQERVAATALPEDGSNASKGGLSDRDRRNLETASSIVLTINEVDDLIDKAEEARSMELENIHNSSIGGSLSSIMRHSDSARGYEPLGAGSLTPTYSHALSELSREIFGSASEQPSIIDFPIGENKDGNSAHYSARRYYLTPSQRLSRRQLPCNLPIIDEFIQQISLSCGCDLPALDEKQLRIFRYLDLTDVPLLT